MKLAQRGYHRFSRLTDFLIYIIIPIVVLQAKVNEVNAARLVSNTIISDFKYNMSVKYCNGFVKCSMSAYSLCFNEMRRNALQRSDTFVKGTSARKKTRSRIVKCGGRVSLHSGVVVMILLALAGDVHANPGPMTCDQATATTTPIGLTLFCMNARSIAGAERLAAFNLQFCENSEADIICLTETWLHENIFENEILDCSQYTVHRKDRQLQGTHREKTRQGGGRAWGGVLTAVSSRYRCRRVEESECNIDSTEIVWVEVFLPSNVSLYIGCAYLPPKPPINLVEYLHLSVSRIQRLARPQDNIVLCGDFNFPDIMWQKCTDYPDILTPVLSGSTNAEMAADFLDTINELDLHQQVPFPTRGANFLDLLFTSNLDFTMTVSHSESAIKSDHSAFTCNIVPPSTRTTHQKRKQVTKYNWNKADLNQLNKLLQKCQWDSLNETDDVNKKCQTFYNLLGKAIEESVPKVKTNIMKYPPWFDREVIKSLNDKNRSFREWKRTDEESKRFQFQSKRTIFKKLVQRKHKEYLKKIDCEISKNPNRLWGYIRRKTKTRRIPTEVEHLGVRASNSDTCCQLFSDYFLSTFQPKSSATTHLPEAPQYGNDSLSSFTISSAEVEQCLKNLDNNKSPGPDSIPIKALKYCYKSLSPPLTAIFNHSIKSGIFPNKWKNAYVTPVLKKGSRYKVINYRPISLLSVLS